MTARRFFALVALVVGCVAASAPAHSAPAGSSMLRSGAFDPPRPAPDFALPATSGDEFRLRRAPAMPDAGPGAPSTAAGYVTLRNRGPARDALISATADVAERVELHETRNMSGMMMTEKVPKVELAPGSRVELKPGSYHLMLIGLKRALTPGQTVELTLEFEWAGRIATRAEVR